MNRLLSLMIFLCAQCAFAWGRGGHKIVGKLAELELAALAPAAFEQVKALLAADPNPPKLKPDDLVGDRGPLLDVAGWADDVRANDLEGDGTFNWHFISLKFEDKVTDFQLNRVCAKTTSFAFENGVKLPAPRTEERADDCIVVQIGVMYRVLVDPKSSVHDRARALKFLVHLVGDMHQPLHAGEWNNDMGGNLRPVFFFDDKDPFYGPLNLHSLWDDNILAKTLRDGGYVPANAPKKVKLAKFAEDRRATVTEEQRASWRDGGLKDWAWETHTYLATNVYSSALTDGVLKEECCHMVFGQPTVDPQFRVKIPQKYYEANAKLVEQQLLKAGVRLAALLSAAFP